MIAHKFALNHSLLLRMTDYAWLFSETARHWLDQLAPELAAAKAPSVKLIQSLRKELSAEQTHLILEQIDLRHRATAKFSSAAQMLFTRRALEQATDEVVARWKSERFAPSSSLADLCCGIGGDLLALAGGNRTVTAVDLDPTMALFARHNAQVYGATLSQISANTGLAEDSSLAEVDAWHIDPDRRSDNRRTVELANYSPPLAALETMLAVNPNALLKLAPAAEVPPAWQSHAEAHWVQSRGECRQLLLAFGNLAHFPACRVATVVDTSTGPQTLVQDGDENSFAPEVGLGEVQAFVFVPQAVVFAAKLAPALARKFPMQPIDQPSGYLTGDQPTTSGLFSTFRVRDQLPLDRKQLKAYLRQHQLGQLEIKKRGCDVDPEALRKQLSPQGDQAAVLLITPVQGKLTVIVADRY